MLPEVTARLDADVSGFVAAWDRAADAAERAAARIRAAGAAAGEGPDASRFRDLDGELRRLTQTARQAADSIRDFGNNTRRAGDDVDHLGTAARNAGNSLGGGGGGGGGGLLGGMARGGAQAKLMAAGIAILASILPAVAAAALATGAALQGMAVVGAVIAAGWKGIEQAGERLKNTLRGLQAQLESTFRTQLSGEFQKLGQAIATLDTPLKAIAVSISGVVKEFTGWIRSAQGMAEIETMLSGVDNMVKSLAPGAKALAQAFTAFGAAAAPAMDEIGAALSSVFENLTEVINKGKETGQLEKAFIAGAHAIEAFGEVLAGVVDVLIEMAGSAGEPAADAIKKFGQALQDAAPLIGTFFHVLAGSINILMTVVGWFAKLAKALEPVYRSMNQAFDGVDKFLKALDPNRVKEFGKAIADFFSGLGKTILDGVDKAVAAVKKWWEDTKKAITKGVDDAVKAVKKWWDDTKRDINKGVEDAIKAIKKFVDDVPKNIKKGVDEAVRVIRQFADDLVEAVQQGIDDFIAACQKWWDDTVRSIEEGIDKAIRAIQELPTKAKQELDKAVKEFKSAGKDMGAGMEEGLQQSAGQFIATAMRIAQAGLNAMKGVLGIRSPSTVFREEVGAMIPAGIADGIIGNAGAITDAMRRSGLAALAAGRGGMAVSGAARGGGGQSFTIQVLGGSDSAAGTMIARLAQQGKLKITANAITGLRR